jgi:hypothetical protein
MDSEFPQEKNFDLYLTSLAIDKVVLLPSKKAAEVFLQKIHPFFVDCIVASADRQHPLNRELNAAVFQLLETDPKIRLVVFNPESLKRISLKTDRILIADDFLLPDYDSTEFLGRIGFRLDEEKLSFFLETFFSQWDKLDSIGNYSYYYKNSSQLSWTEEWPLQLLL